MIKFINKHFYFLYSISFIVLFITALFSKGEYNVILYVELGVIIALTVYWIIYWLCVQIDKYFKIKR